MNAVDYAIEMPPKSKAWEGILVVPRYALLEKPAIMPFPTRVLPESCLPRNYLDLKTCVLCGECADFPVHSGIMGSLWGQYSHDPTP